MATESLPKTPGVPTHALALPALTQICTLNRLLTLPLFTISLLNLASSLEFLQFPFCWGDDPWVHAIVFLGMSVNMTAIAGILSGHVSHEAELAISCRCFFLVPPIVTAYRAFTPIRQEEAGVGPVVLLSHWYLLAMIVNDFLTCFGSPAFPHKLMHVVWMCSTLLSLSICVRSTELQAFIVPLMLSNLVSCCTYAFYRHVMQWTYFSSSLLDDAFDATFLVTADPDPVVFRSNPRLDQIFGTSMESCTLDRMHIRSGMEALHALFKESGEQSPSMRHAHATCCDQEGWEFDMELRVSKQHTTGSLVLFLCGLRLMGEKRPAEESQPEKAVFKDLAEQANNIALNAARQSGGREGLRHRVRKELAAEAGCAEVTEQPEQENR